MSHAFPLATGTPEALGFAPAPLAALERLILRHLEEGRFPGCQIALARHGKLALARSYGEARPGVRAADETLWLLYSNTKILTMAAVWALLEDGQLSFSDRVADHLPEFAVRGKGDITLYDVTTHQAGYPSAVVSREAWADHARMRAEVCEFSLEWTPGSRMHYHGLSAHYTLAMVIEAVTGLDYRDVIRQLVIEPLGLGHELKVGVPAAEQGRCADISAAPELNRVADNSAEFRSAGVPGGGGFGTARGMAAFYQMMLGQGRLGDVRLLSPRLVGFVTRDFSGEQIDHYMGLPMHRGLGPHSRGRGPHARGLGSLAPADTFGHGGIGSSYCWADPASGVSFAYITNHVAADPWHSARMDRVSNLIHAAID